MIISTETMQIRNEDGTFTPFLAIKGDKGDRGDDGYTPQKGVDYVDGAKGDKGDKGDKGENGDDGYTPQKGVDYFDGEKGTSGIAYQEDEPTDTDIKVWIKPSDDDIIDITSVNYSLEEQVIGTWIDGSTLYQKTIDLGNLPYNGTKDCGIIADKVKFVVSYDGYMFNSSDKTYQRPIPHIETSSNFVKVDISNNVLRVTTTSDWSAYKGYLTVKYTKKEYKVIDMFNDNAWDSSENHYSNSLQMTRYADHFNFYQSRQSTDQIVVVSEDSVDLTDYKKLTCTLTKADRCTMTSYTSWDYFAFGLYKTKPTSAGTFPDPYELLHAQAISEGSATGEIDLSSYTGEYYIGIIVGSYSSGYDFDVSNMVLS